MFCSWPKLEYSAVFIFATREVAKGELRFCLTGPFPRLPWQLAMVSIVNETHSKLLVDVENLCPKLGRLGGRYYCTVCVSVVHKHEMREK